jgi:hypothetical protein
MTLSEGSLSDPWSYTEQLLHTLDEFETPDGFRIKHSETVPEPSVLGLWRISLSGPAPVGNGHVQNLRSRFNIWLVMVPEGWVLSETPSILRRGGELRSPLYASPEEALTEAKQLLCAREAAVRLGAR